MAAGPHGGDLRSGLGPVAAGAGDSVAPLTCSGCSLAVGRGRVAAASPLKLRTAPTK
jgi:hypothetical protein